MGFSGQSFEFFQVHSCAECFACAGKDRNLRLGFLNLIQRPRQFIEQLKAKSVPFVGTIQRQAGNVIVSRRVQSFDIACRVGQQIIRD